MLVADTIYDTLVIGINPVDSSLLRKVVASYRHTEQETGSSPPQVAERHSWYHLER